MTGTPQQQLEALAAARWRIALTLTVAMMALYFGFILLIVTYGHTLVEPLFSTQGHIFPRGLFLLAALALPAEEDILSVDSWLRRRRRAT